MSNLILLRHGQSQWNLENRFTGWTNVDLTEKGKYEASQAGSLLNKNNIRIDKIYTSYLKRAINTAEICLKYLKNKDIKVIYDWRLNERHYGALQGLNKAEIAKKYGDEQVLKWRRSYSTSPPKMEVQDKKHPLYDKLYSNVDPNLLPSSESLKDTLNRVMPVINGKLIPEMQNGKNLMVVAHGNSLRAISKVLKNISDEDIVSLNIPTGEPIVFEIANGFKLVKDYYLKDINEI